MSAPTSTPLRNLRAKGVPTEATFEASEKEWQSIVARLKREKNKRIESLESEMQQWRRENEDLRIALEGTKAQHQMKLDEMELSQKKKMAGLDEDLKQMKEKSGDFSGEKKKLTATIKKLTLELENLKKERLNQMEDREKGKEEVLKMQKKMDEQKSGWDEKRGKLVAQGAKSKAKVQVLQSELQKALRSKEEFRKEIKELEEVIRAIHPKDIERQRAAVRLNERNKKEKNQIRVLEQLLAESEETEKLHLEEKRILREEMNFLRKTLSEQQQTSALHLHLNAPSPTPKLSSPSSPLPPPRVRGEEEGAGAGGGAGGGGEVFWVCYGGKKAKVGVEAGTDVDDLRAVVCKMFLLDNPALFDVVQIPEFLDPATPVVKLSKTSMVFLVHANTRAVHGDEECIRMAEEKVNFFLSGQSPTDDEEIQEAGPNYKPKIDLPSIFSFKDETLSSLFAPPTSLVPLQWPNPPLPEKISVPEWEYTLPDPPLPPRLPSWLMDTGQGGDEIAHLRDCLFHLQMLLKNSEDSEQIHVEQERTLRREVDLLKKEINVLKYESDLDLPCLRNCIMRLLLCQRHEEMEQLLPVIANILQCTTVDMEMVKRAFEARKKSISVYGVTVYGPERNGGQRT